VNKPLVYLTNLDPLPLLYVGLRVRVAHRALQVSDINASVGDWTDGFTLRASEFVADVRACVR